MAQAAKKQPQVFYSKHAAGLTVYFDGKGTALSKTHPNYERVLEALRKSDFEAVRRLGNISETISAAARAVSNTQRDVIVEDGELFYINGSRKEPLTGPLADRIMTAVSNGMTETALRPLILFMDNIMKNRLKAIREELYLFMMRNELPITNDGCFLAYKRVRGNFTDCHTGKFDNSPGKLVAMPADQVDTNRHATCSRGLHFCSRSYLPHFGEAGGRTVIVKVNPRFVFAIPNDYDNAKGRCSEYYVVGECLGNPDVEEHFLSQFVFDENKLHEVAPKVKFVKPAPGGTALKPSLEAIAEGYKLTHKGKTFVRVMTSKGAYAPEQYQVVVKKGKDFVSALTGKLVSREHVKVMSAKTKSVRAALVRAVARARNRRV